METNCSRGQGLYAKQPDGQISKNLSSPSRKKYFA